MLLLPLLRQILLLLLRRSLRRVPPRAQVQVQLRLRLQSRLQRLHHQLELLLSTSIITSQSPGLSPSTTLKLQLTTSREYISWYWSFAPVAATTFTYSEFIYVTTTTIVSVYATDSIEASRQSPPRLSSPSTCRSPPFTNPMPNFHFPFNIRKHIYIYIYKYYLNK